MVVTMRVVRGVRDVRLGACADLFVLRGVQLGDPHKQRGW